MRWSMRPCVPNSAGLTTVRCIGMPVLSHRVISEVGTELVHEPACAFTQGVCGTTCGLLTGHS